MTLIYPSFGRATKNKREDGVAVLGTGAGPVAAIDWPRIFTTAHVGPVDASS
jgi:hypothetical protein